MKKTTQRSSLWYVMLLLLPLFGLSQTTAIYTISFESDWKSPEHGTLPGTAHWSNLVGATHNSNHIFWQEGQLATLGVERVAEIGNNAVFESEVNAQITAGNANQYLEMAFDAPNNAASGASLVSIQVNEDYPLITLLSMIAPSPDWFVGVNSYSLLDSNGNWKDGIVMDMFPYDAGTEEGFGYSTSNSPSNPHVPIFDRSSIAPFTGPRVGRLILTLEDVLSINSETFGETILVTPNPASDLITIRNTARTNLDAIYIYNVLGDLVKKTEINAAKPSISIALNQFDSGLYIVKIESKSGLSTTKKLIVK